MAPLRRAPRSVPWIQTSEWEWVYSALYSQEPATQRLGVFRVRAWASRGKVPHSVESTSALIEVGLHDAGLLAVLSESELRLQYSMVFIRFVNGLIDHAQKGVYAASAAAVADSLGLPPWFVELRHAATHDRLPTLALLRSGRTQALEWLRNHYWNTQRVFVADARASTIAAVTSYAAAMASIADGKNANTTATHELQEITHHLTADTYSDIIVPILLEPGFFVPKPTKTSIQTTFNPTKSFNQVWARLIETCEAEWTGFTEDLVLAAVDAISQDVSADADEQDLDRMSSDDFDDVDMCRELPTESVDSHEVLAHKTALVAWINFLIKRYGEVENMLDVEKIAKACLATKSDLTIPILDFIVRNLKTPKDDLVMLVRLMQKRIELETKQRDELATSAPATVTETHAQGKKDGSKELNAARDVWDVTEKTVAKNVAQARQRIREFKSSRERVPDLCDDKGDPNADDDADAASDSALAHAGLDFDMQSSMDNQPSASGGGWQLHDPETWQSCPIGMLPGRQWPSLDLPNELDNVSFALTHGILHIPVHAYMPNATMHPPQRVDNARCDMSDLQTGCESEHDDMTTNAMYQDDMQSNMPEPVSNSDPCSIVLF